MKNTSKNEPYYSKEDLERLPWDLQNHLRMVAKMLCWESMAKPDIGLLGKTFHIEEYSLTGEAYRYECNSPDSWVARLYLGGNVTIAREGGFSDQNEAVNSVSNMLFAFYMRIQDAGIGGITVTYNGKSFEEVNEDREELDQAIKDFIREIL